ncbi:uncharacterized protein ALTATR162_LOCUS652 [Alternaria atra]|uniref:Prion-inhibition and propagation HeLo domain-containing protein n=1 Tax=Alternaria atra TaxID=119953 RepID=A0A8J2HTY6_9PLEO|nr:uncharacterized protein ALTATR162_LOCUS652 [Alternaria atra]CAG5140179.1 unnamed protein product [Alternaria atra]
MEGAGLAVGIAALAGLFNNAVDCFEYVRLGRAFGTNFQTSLLKLDNARLRLSRWGESVGLDGDFGNAHAIKLATGPPEDVAAAERVLSQIMNLFANAEGISKKYRSRTGEADWNLAILDVATDMEPLGQSLHEKMRTMSVKRQNSTPLRQKVQWALYEEKHFKRLIEDVTDLVNDLVQLFPAVLEEQRRLCRTEASTIGSSDCLLALQDITALQDKELHQAVVETLLSKGHRNTTFNNYNSKISQ